MTFLHKGMSTSLFSVSPRPTSLFSVSPRPTSFAMVPRLLQSSTFSYSPFSSKVNLSTPHHEWPKEYIIPYDICFRGRRNRGSMGAPLQGENKESRIHEIKKKSTNGSVLRPGMVLLKEFLSHDEQVEIVRVCRELGVGLGGFYQPLNRNGTLMQLRMMCLGRNWNPVTHKYGKMRRFDRTIPPSIPNNFSELVTRAIQEAQSLIKKTYRACNEKEVLPSMTPDICIVNFYTNDGKLGLHQDRDESKESLRKGLPVVSFSVGNSAYFLYGDERNPKKATSVALDSGDVLIFGGESRLVFHGVSTIFPNSAPKELMKDSRLSPGRLNLTFRQF
ncbi:uncharacterized protein LOC106764415 [Vigna radiata var. radiata]|uniref:Uncharacterized protein LOC106764415 n=1 Tax=Vigna radiata var. radiata TaxID=3916 RepID=A0A1S3UDT3_VIGRR|nr:uncharacterized protein LOC106764415 [Vigna radiata var. radiata]